jgi:hypothetical protein
MSENNEGEQPEEPKTFTQEQVNALIASEKRKFGEKYADYDELKTKAAQLDEIAQASKSDLEKALERASQAEAKVAAFEQREQVSKWAKEITKDSAIPASALRGNTREELEAHFKELEALIPKQQPPKRTPVPAGKPAGEGGGSAAVAALRQLRGTA